MTKILSFLNNKGGVGKTTSAVNTAKALFDKGFSVLLIDADAQGNASKMCGFTRENKGADTPTLYNLLTQNCKVEDCIYIEGEDKEYSFDFIPSSQKLINAEQELVTAIGREMILKRAISPILSCYNFIIIDCPPSGGLIAMNAMCASDYLIVPLNCEIFALDGMGVISAKTMEVKTLINPNLEILGYLMTRYDNRISLHRTAKQQMVEMFPNKVFETSIRTNIALAESPAMLTNIFDYAPQSNGAKDYLNFTEELIKKLEENGKEKEF